MGDFSIYVNSIDNNYRGVSVTSFTSKVTNIKIEINDTTANGGKYLRDIIRSGPSNRQRKIKKKQDKLEKWKLKMKGR